jgi:hypothetical protein
MDGESRKLLEETFELTKENNKLLHRVRGVQKWQAFWSIARIVIIAGIALGALYYLEPYIEKLIGIYNQISGVKQTIDSASLQNILKNIKP